MALLYRSLQPQADVLLEKAVASDPQSKLLCIGCSNSWAVPLKIGTVLVDLQEVSRKHRGDDVFDIWRREPRVELRKAVCRKGIGYGIPHRRSALGTIPANKTTHPVIDECSI